MLVLLTSTFQNFGHALSTFDIPVCTKSGTIAQAVNQQQSPQPNIVLISGDPNFFQDDSWKNPPDISLDTFSNDALPILLLIIMAHHALYDVTCSTNILFLTKNITTDNCASGHTFHDQKYFVSKLSTTDAKIEGIGTNPLGIVDK